MWWLGDFWTARWSMKFFISININDLYVYVWQIPAILVAPRSYQRILQLYTNVDHFFGPAHPNPDPSLQIVKVVQLHIASLTRMLLQRIFWPLQSCQPKTPRKRGCLRPTFECFQNKTKPSSKRPSLWGAGYEVVQVDPSCRSLDAFFPGWHGSWLWMSTSQISFTFSPSFLDAVARP